MSQNEFIEFIKKQAFLGEVRQRELIDNAPWMTDEERAALVKKISDTAQKTEENTQLGLHELEKVHLAVKEFQKVQLPQLAKAEEASEHEGEQKAADQLLKNL